ncbi:uncharacterized protein BKA78DRAFT_373721 [Phyllosticta capitalensis]|uniref:uncharacterized protein n=1 Tax=Phyllosticta capitalensis TaxID=121624 RepID=UPI003130E96C
MPRQAYNADLRAVINSNDYPEGVSAFRRGDDDGFIEFTFAPPEGGSFSVTAIVSDVSDYPSSHSYVFLVDDAAPPDFAASLMRASDSLLLQPGQSIRNLLNYLSTFFYSGDDESMADAEDSGMSDDDDDGDFGDDPSFFDYDGDSPTQRFNPLVSSNGSLSREDRNKIRQDLRLVKEAGFKVGATHSLLLGEQAYISISCQIKRLGISEEAMQAWGISPEEYLILLIRYPKGYKTMRGFRTTDVPSKDCIEFRTGIGFSYKPSIEDMCNAFSSSSSKDRHQTTATFRKHFISEAMHHSLNDTFLAFLKCRIRGASWDGATLFYHDFQGAPSKWDSLTAADVKYQHEVAPSSAFPSLVTADHVNDDHSESGISLPLVAMQFTVRKFVRSPDYCLNCHRRMPEGLEALKPYVCDIPLCLFQYMQMGLGPRIEHEIVTQPRVVDLLVTLCYYSARIGSLGSSHLPKGLALRIPPLEVLQHGQVNYLSRGENGMLQMTDSENPKSVPSPINSIPVQVNLDHLDIIFPDHLSKKAMGLQVGDWIAFKIKSKVGILHAQIENLSHFPRILIASPIVMPLTASQSAVKPDVALRVPLPSGSHDAVAWRYATECDRLGDRELQEVIKLLLEMLPTVDEMKHSIHQSGSDLNKSISHRIPPPALGLLRWIIASNRACIMQIGLPSDTDDVDTGLQEAVHGMDGWMQFKFAMGAPDKERRFVQSVQKIKAKIPTMFAWHGSPLQNWHSIIRDGLNYDQVVHGRAYGDGIYFARDANTSIGYSGSNRSIVARGFTGSWPLSKINPSTVLSLSEVVNAPSQFVNTVPYYVVNNTDWTQTRYLFVQSLQSDGMAQKAEVPIPTFATPQDPNVTPTGSTGKQLVIPASKTTRNANHAVSMGRKKFKASGSATDPVSIDIDDDASSVATDDEDRTLLEPEEETAQDLISTAMTKTDFVPGTLDRSKLPTMAPPTGEAASATATKCLQRDYNDTLKEQNKKPLHELGWYIDPEIMMETGNLYQWIVELHSFDPDIPLAQDMKAHGVKSVVLEIRFGKEYPMAPPFVRVIRPRFLPFLNGGGGHVTAGGALCMELLTNDGWNAGMTIEAVLLQVRLAMSSDDPAPARLERGGGRGEYGVGEAVEAYIRACQRHGWTIPAGFRAMARSMGY